MIPAIVTDELSDSPETAFELGLEQLLLTFAVLYPARRFERKGHVA